jgi:predicted amidohydrolase
MNLNVAIIQANLHWENKQENLNLFSNKIENISEVVDLIVLPEMFTTGFTMNPEKFAEEMNGETIGWMQKKANEKNCVIVGSFVCVSTKKYFNRLVWMRSDGTFEYYDKKHLFSMGDENKHYTAGEKRIIVELNGWKICPLICYDLRFPIWSRNNKNNPFDALIYIANWPEKRSYPWKTLLLARAIENQCYVIGLNRIGNDGSDINHSGDSAVINAKGEMISKIITNEEAVEIVTLDRESLIEFRKSFPVLNDAD